MRSPLSNDPEFRATFAREIAKPAFKICSLLAMFASQLSLNILALMIWRRFHPAHVRAPAWFDFLGVSVVVVSMTAALLAAVRVGRVSRTIAAASLFGGILSGIGIFFVNQLLTAVR